MQTIFRVNKNQGDYTQISNSVLNDNSLSGKALGVMCKLLSKPNNWRVIITNIVKSFADGKDSIYAALKELELKGYIVRIKTKDNKGRFINHTFVFEAPDLKNTKEATLAIQEALMGNNKLLNKPYKFKKSVTENPIPTNYIKEKAATENPPLLNNDLLNNYKDLPPTPQKKITSKNQPAKNLTSREGVFNNHQSFLNHKITNNQTINNIQQPWYKKIFSKQDTENTNTNFSNKELTLLNPIALKLFEQTNPKILSRLRTEINEFDITPESIDECLKRLDLSKIKANPYKYFALTYAASVTAMVKVKNNTNITLESLNSNPKMQLQSTDAFPIDMVAKELWEKETAHISSMFKNLAIPIGQNLLKVPEVLIPKISKLLQENGLKWEIEGI